MMDKPIVLVPEPYQDQSNELILQYHSIYTGLLDVNARAMEQCTTDEAKAIFRAWSFQIVYRWKQIVRDCELELTGRGIIFKPYKPVS